MIERVAVAEERADAAMEVPSAKKRNNTDNSIRY
jgi:hypothetical protein